MLICIFTRIWVPTCNFSPIVEKRNGVVGGPTGPRLFPFMEYGQWRVATPISFYGVWPRPFTFYGAWPVQGGPAPLSLYGVRPVEGWPRAFSELPASCFRGAAAKAMHCGNGSARHFPSPTSAVYDKGFTCSPTRPCRGDVSPPVCVGRVASPVAPSSSSLPLPLRHVRSDRRLGPAAWRTG